MEPLRRLRSYKKVNENLKTFEKKLLRKAHLRGANPNAKLKGCLISRRTKATFKRNEKIKLKNIVILFLNEEIRRKIDGFPHFM